MASKNTKKNTWNRLKMKDLLNWLKTNAVSQLKFSKAFGISNSTFHNWKRKTAVPSDEVQERLASVITGVVELTFPESRGPGRPKKVDAPATPEVKAPKATKTKTPGKVSTSTLDSLRGGKSAPAKAAAKPAKVTKKATKKATKKKVSVGVVDRAKQGNAAKLAGSVASAASGNPELADRLASQIVSQYLAENPINTLEELGQVLSTVHGSLVTV